jgi:spore coat polysaccharide biosynthesis protein SpsF (cytidylyltransferase family)
LTNLNIVAIVQARISSTRLPGKVLKNLGSRRVLDHVFHQLSGAKHITKSVLATSDDKSDDTLENWANHAGIDCVRGSLTDVLDRYYTAAIQFQADAVVRITADCPLLDPNVVDAVVERFLGGKYEYVSNINPPTFPDGLDNEIMTFTALERAWTDACEAPDREHVTPYIRNHPEIFRQTNVENSSENGGNLSALRLTLDTAQDYEFLDGIVRQFEAQWGTGVETRFTLQTIRALLS